MKWFILVGVVLIAYLKWRVVASGKGDKETVSKAWLLHNIYSKEGDRE